MDLQALQIVHREEQVQALATQEAGHPCNLAKGPLLRVFLLRILKQEHVVLLTLHHIITDGWSSEVLVYELLTLYRANSEKLPTELTPLPIQYADYALWQREWLQGDVLEAELAYWREQLAEIPLLQLSTDHPRPAIQTYRGAREVRRLPLAHSKDLITLSRAEHVTLFMLLLAAFQVLLSRYTGQSDISVGTPIANRRQAELEGLIGFFVNTLVLRSDLGSNPTFIQVLQRVRNVCLAAYTHQDIPFEKVVEELAPERDLSRSPLFQVMFVLQNRRHIQKEIVGVRVEPLIVDSLTSKFDLTLLVAETEQGLYCSLEYNTDLFEAETIRHLLVHWQSLLEGIVIAHASRARADAGAMECNPV
ncbi:MAG: hypothetical protein E6J34_22010 [Chloroflexi bacterium]|nr:MAG: hypothetical protein E6J34_22010 [Chloroflexota bacterium]